jgi:hypothetical protein
MRSLRLSPKLAVETSSSALLLLLLVAVSLLLLLLPLARPNSTSKSSRSALDSSPSCSTPSAGDGSPPSTSAACLSVGLRLLRRRWLPPGVLGAGAAVVGSGFMPYILKALYIDHISNCKVGQKNERQE